MTPELSTRIIELAASDRRFRRSLEEYLALRPGLSKTDLTSILRLAKQVTYIADSLNISGTDIQANMELEQWLQKNTESILMNLPPKKPWWRLW
jgi:hypothetical protein